MNCDTYLAMLETLPVDELAYGTAREHAARCRDCDRITRVVAERERNMLMAYGDVGLSASAGEIASRALATSRRRTVALYYRIALGVATVATILVMIMSRQRTGPFLPTRVSETFRLQCLSPDQAAELLRPRARATAISFRPDSPLGLITVEASPAEMERTRFVLEQYDTPAASQCGVQLPVPAARAAPAAQAGRPVPAMR